MEEEITLPMSGVLGDIDQQFSLEDYLVGSAGNIPELETQDQIYYQYNQGMTAYCTVYASMTGISATTNYQFTDNDIKEILAKVPASVKTNGWWLNLAVDVVRNRYNKKFPNDKVVSLGLSTRGVEAIDALNKGYFITTSFKYNLDYFRDANDGMLNGKDFKPSLGGHAVNLSKGIIVVDNYYGKQNNVYGIQYYDDLVTNGVFSQNGFIFVKEMSMEQKKADLVRMKDMVAVMQVAIDNNSKLRGLTNDLQLKTMLHDMNLILKNKINFIQLKV